MTAGSQELIARVDAWKYVTKLPESFPLGAITISHRDCVVVRIETQSGLQGDSYGLARGAPIDQVVTELIAPILLGRDVTDIDALTAAVAGQLPQHALEGVFLRAMSHVDIAA